MKKSKICIITPRSINDSPCLDKYREIIQEPFDIICWEKGGEKESCGANNTFRYTGFVPVEGGKLSKIKHYFLFTLFVKKHVKKNRYKKLIIFPTHMSWLLLNMLKHKYNGKYILDIRDYAGEEKTIIRKLTSAAVHHSGLCTITSPSYKVFLPNDVKYVVSHNLQSIDSEIINSYRKRNNKSNHPIVLSFIGTVRFLEQQKRIITVFANDTRFVLQYIGRGSEALRNYCIQNNIKNVHLIGQFNRSELGRFYLDTDMAINVYGNSDPALIYALSNKLYSAALMGMPVICSPHTFTEKVVEKYKFGCSIDLSDPHCSDAVYEYYTSLDQNLLHKNCDKFINDVKCDEKKYKASIVKFITENK